LDYRGLTRKPEVVSFEDAKILRELGWTKACPHYWQIDNTTRKIDVWGSVAHANWNDWIVNPGRKGNKWSAPDKRQLGKFRFKLLIYKLMRRHATITLQ